ncbi:hypothetical protein Tco_0785997 [Tanacetum coccineum]
MRLFQFSLCDQASNWLERLPAGSITTWEDLTTRFLAQFFPPGWTVKLRNDILMFQQHHGESLSEAWTLNKTTTSCEICSGPHDTQYCMEDPEQAFLEYASSRTDEAGDARLSKFKSDFKQQQSEMTNKINTILKAITDRIAGALPSDTVKNPKLSTYPVLAARSYPTEDSQCSTHIHGSINTITIYPKQQNDSRDSMGEEEEQEREGNPKDTNTIAYIEERRDTPLLERKDITAVGNLGSNKDDEGIEWKHGLMTFMDETKEVTIKIPYKDPEKSELSSEGHDLLSSGVILSEDDYDRGCRKPSDLKDGFYKDIIKLGPEYLTGVDDEGEVTKFLIKNEEEIFTDAGDGVRIYPNGIRIYPDGVASLAM